MRAEDGVRIRHMIEAAESAMRFVEGRSRADLEHDEMLRFALVCAIEIIGEAASKVSDEGRAGYGCTGNPFLVLVQLKSVQLPE